ncbi:MAG: FkbM family methyltransferase [Polyangiaceae bacterium]
MDAQERWYREVLRLEGEVVADVGANVGRLSAFFFEAVGPKGRVVSIEPIPANIAAIDKRIRKAGPRAKKRWQLKRCAVAPTVGKVRMRVVNAAWGTNAMVTSEGDELVEVAARPLVDLVPDATVVKLDIEGQEYAILPGALAEMPGVHTWALELHGVEGYPLEETLGLLKEHGFELLAAGQRRDDPKVWLSLPIDSTLTWDAIPGTPTTRDGLPGVFKMLHVVARRR